MQIWFGEVLVLSFGGFFLTELLKALLPVKVAPWVKLLAVTVLIGGLAIPLTEWTAIPVALGFAPVIHSVHKSVSAWGDAQRVHVLHQSRRR